MTRAIVRIVYVLLFAALAVGYYEFLGAGATPSLVREALRSP